MTQSNLSLFCAARRDSASSRALVSTRRMSGRRPRQRHQRVQAPEMPPAIWQPLWLSTWVSGTATLIGLIVGSGLGYLLARKRFAGRDVLDSVVLLPLVL